VPAVLDSVLNLEAVAGLAGSIVSMMQEITPLIELPLSDHRHDCACPGREAYSRQLAWRADPGRRHDDRHVRGTRSFPCRLYVIFASHSSHQA